MHSQIRQILLKSDHIKKGHRKPAMNEISS